MKSKRFTKWPLDWLVLFSLAVLYIFQRSREPALGDALSFTVAAIDGFDWSSNATNHFLYINFLHLLTLIFPFAKPHSLFVAVSIVAALGTLFMLNKILQLLQIETFIRLMVLSILGLSYTFWRHAEIVEVYTLNLAFTAWVVFWFVNWNLHNEDKYVYRASAILGIAMLVHVQQVLYLPFLAIWYYWTFRGNFKKWLYGALAFLIPASVLVWPVVFWQTNTFSSIFFDNSFQDEVLGFDMAILAKGFMKSLFFLAFNFGLYALIMAYSLKRNLLMKNLKTGLLLLGATVFVFAARYNVSDNYVFFLPSYFVLCIFLASFLQQWRKKTARYKMLFLSMIFPTLFVYGFGLIILQRTQAGRQLQAEKWYKGGLSFFINPGMKGKPSAVDVANWLNEGKIDKNENLEIAQNAENALRYLQQNQEKPH